MTEILEILETGRESLRGQLATVEQTISNLRATGESRYHVSLKILSAGRESLAAQLKTLEKIISNIQAIVASNSTASGNELHRDSSQAPSPNQYEGMKLSTAVQAYLSERGRGPISAIQIARHLTDAGVRVGKSQDLPDVRHLRILCANNRARFTYDRGTDTITLRSTPGNDTGKAVAGRGSFSPSIHQLA